MKYIKIILLLTFFITTLNAEYLRTIRISTFLTNDDAQEALIKLDEFKQKHPDMLELQKEWNFEFKARKSGEYYITFVEPFTDRVVLQKVLDILRLEYKDVYVTKLKQEIVKVKEEKVFVPLPKEIPNPIVKVESKIKEKIPTTKPTEIKKVIEKTIQKPAQSTNIWFILFLITSLILAIVLRLFFMLRRENKIYQKSNRIKNEKYEQLYKDMKEKERFISYASHELRTPITSIIGLAHIVLESGLDKVQKDYIQIIKSSSENLLNIANDILDILKIKAAELKLEKIEFNINDVLEYALRTISYQAKNNNIDLRMNVDNDVPSYIIGDSLRLGQILINLLGNAVKFTKDGEVVLNIRKIDNDKDSITLEFSVSDTGIGMNNSQISEIFNSYSQANKSTSRKFGGTGLGLSISKQLVEMMDGDIKVDSKIDVGTTFTFDSKFKLKDSGNKRQYRLPSVELLDKKVLVVDSSDINIVSLKRRFGYFKYQVDSISSFEDMTLEDNSLFDIVIVNQTKMTPLAIEKLKEIQSKDKSKIVILSELYSSLNDDLVKDLKIDSNLKTPFTQQTILNLILELYISKKSDKKPKKKIQKDILNGMAGKKILVAEDNELNHKVITGLLSETGIELVFAIDGEEALRLIKGNKDFDMVLMDINMPKVNGYEVAQEIRKDSAYNNLPILAFTADVMDEAIEKAISSGMQGHISKPIIIDIFYKRIFDALNDTKVQINNIEDSDEPSSVKDDTEFEELTTTVGLERCDNDVEFYKSILKEFKIIYTDSGKTLEELSQDEHFKEAKHKAMDIKDVALNIGAYNLCEYLVTLEYELDKGKQGNWAKLIDLYDIGLKKLIIDIDNYLDKA